MTPENDTTPRGGLSRLLRGFDALVDAATGILFLTGAIAMFAMVVTRYGFAWSDPSVEILVVYSMIWGTFIGLSAGVRYGVNIRFSLLEQLLGPGPRRVVRTAAHLLTFVIAAGLAVSGWYLVDETMMFNEVMPTSLRWPVWPFHVSILAGGALLCLQVVRSIAELWRSDAAASAEPADGGVV